MSWDWGTYCHERRKEEFEEGNRGRACNPSRWAENHAIGVPSRFYSHWGIKFITLNPSKFPFSWNLSPLLIILWLLWNGYLNFYTCHSLINNRSSFHHLLVLYEKYKGNWENLLCAEENLTKIEGQNFVPLKGGRGWVEPERVHGSFVKAGEWGGSVHVWSYNSLNNFMGFLLCMREFKLLD